MNTNFPLFFIERDKTEDVPFYKDNVYLNIEIGISEKKPLREKEVEEISEAEYFLVFQEAYNELIEEICSSKGEIK